eukprot:1196064-Prorocentrum_minimum.AAC.1
MAIDLIRYAAADVGLQLPLKLALLDQHAKIKSPGFKRILLYCSKARSRLSRKMSTMYRVPGRNSDQDVMKRTLVASSERVKEYRDLDEAHCQGAGREQASVAPTF